ncbi:TauD/TfdA family dioxygenase [Aliikangiella sp. G2MR2-5]|uniref:TauD/TfdA family dioxygenase n=1 Tax=Aliikangiella sp. G2MR2-5 TaxID=2788943 RepID=UPI0018AC52B4|nr:TauD/TfdA family dioxygenase [Aliikangiella sp. G2MR2-5]
MIEDIVENKQLHDHQNLKNLPNEVVNQYFFNEEDRLPLVYEAKQEAINLQSFYQQNEEQIQANLLEYGAILFRGFELENVEDFEGVIQTVLEEVTPYLGGATPRKVISSKVSTSTEFPSDQEISLHNELSYEHSIPSKLLFFCLQQPVKGGQTQIADVNRVFDYIDSEIISAFYNNNGWKLIRNYGMGFGPNVESGFGTTDVDEIKRECEKRDVELQVIKSDLLRTIHLRSAVTNHPNSDLPLWLNHIVFWHSSSLPKQYFEYMSNAFAPEEFPYFTCYGNGESIPDEFAENIRAAYRKAEVVFDWQKGDVLLLDNYRVAHGRKPFEGERKILVSMGN